MFDVVGAVGLLHQCHDIETHLIRQVIMPQIGVGSVDDAAALGRCHGLLGSHIFERRAGLHFHDNQNIVFACHNVEFILAIAPIDIAHDVTSRYEILGSPLLAPFTGVIMSCHIEVSDMLILQPTNITILFLPQKINRVKACYLMQYRIFVPNAKNQFVMKTFKKALPGLCIGIGLIVMAVILSHGIITVKDRDRIVTVKGLAEREVNADRVIWPLVFKEVGNDMSEIYTSLNRKNEIVCDFLKENGIGDEEISIAAPQIIDMRAERYVNSNEINYRYNVTSVITVTSGQIDKVRQLIVRQADLLKKGVAITGDDYRYTTQYEFTRLNDIKPEMIEEATMAARNAAEKFAKDSDSKLGKIRRANQGQFVISDRDNNTPYIKQVRVVTTIDYYLKD